MEEILRAEGLCKTFTLSRKQQKIERTTAKRKTAVNNLTFNAYRGEIFGLLGPNGAGKTTTLRMLSTLIRPDEGDALLDGCSVVKCMAWKRPPSVSVKSVCSAVSELTSSPR